MTKRGGRGGKGKGPATPARSCPICDPDPIPDLAALSAETDAQLARMVEDLQGEDGRLAETFRQVEADTDRMIEKLAAEDGPELFSGEDLRLAKLAPALRDVVRDLVNLPALWGSASARPVVEKARDLLKRAEKAA